jgi:tight adherence protein C
MIEPLVAASLAAVAGGSAAAAALTSMPRRVSLRRAYRTRQIHLTVPRTAAAKRRALDREVPQLLDLLASASAAGLSAVAGFRQAVAALRGPLAEELRRCLGSVDLGARWRTELTGASEHLRRVVAILSRTETLGTSLSDATRELAADVRAARRAAVAERARTAPVKMLFPLVFLILPAFLLLTVVPVLLTTVRSIR